MENLTGTLTPSAIYLILGLLITFSVFLFLNSNSAISFSELKSKILFDNETFDFGKVSPGISLEYSFSFTNEGTSPLKIEKVQPSNDCTGAVSDGESEFSEGESGIIKITFSTNGSEGHLEKQVHVITNDAENPDKVLTLFCDIVNGQ